MSAGTLTPLPSRTPEKLDSFQKSNLAERILLLRLVAFRRARRTNTMTLFVFPSHLPSIGAFMTNGANHKPPSSFN
jgi:hypothetical protein